MIPKNRYQKDVYTSVSIAVISGNNAGLLPAHFYSFSEFQVFLSHQSEYEYIFLDERQ